MALSSNLPSLTLLILLPKRLSPIDVSLLMPLRAAAEQDDEDISILSEIDPVTRTEIYATLEYPAADPFHVGEIAGLDPGQDRHDMRRWTGVQPLKPFCIGTPASEIDVFPDLDHSSYGNT